MRLLLITQAVDLDDPVLSFAHAWAIELSRHFEHIHLVCLKEGRRELPANITVHSLGKESGASRVKYVARFFKYAWMFRGEYDAVLVHMNQEYVLLGGPLWKLLGKRVYLWRNHYSGGLRTTLAVSFCTKVFCTSRFSYTARFRRTVIMPVGIDTDVFKSDAAMRKSGTVLFLGRIAMSKRIDVLLQALAKLRKKDITVRAEVYGDALPRDAAYLDDLKTQARTLGIADVVDFKPGVPNNGTPAIFAAHELFYNGSKSGMYDKTIFEAAACGALPIASSADYARIADPRLVFDGSAASLADAIERVLALPDGEKEALRARCLKIAQDNSLSALGARLAEEMA